MITLVKFQQSSKPFWDSFWFAEISKSVAAITADTSPALSWLADFIRDSGKSSPGLEATCCPRTKPSPDGHRVSTLLFSVGFLSRLISSAYGSRKTEFNGALLPPTDKSGVCAERLVGETRECCHIFLSLTLKIWYNIPRFIVFKIKLLRNQQFHSTLCKSLKKKKTVLLQPTTTVTVAYYWGGL